MQSPPRDCEGNLPGLQWPILPRHHVDRNRGLRDIDAQLEQFTVDLGSAPQRVLNTHSSDQIAHLFADPWSATVRTGIPSPIRSEAHSMPTQNSLGPDDGYGVKNAKTATKEWLTQPDPSQEAKGQADAGGCRKSQRQEVKGPCLRRAYLRHAEGADGDVHPHHRAGPGDNEKIAPEGVPIPDIPQARTLRFVSCSVQLSPRA
jgi:hypothetical protein